MSLLSAVVLGLSKEVIKETCKPKQYDCNKLVSLSSLNLLKKYPFKVRIKKLKSGYQMLVFFKDKGNEILVYATKKGELELVTKKMEMFSLKGRKTQQVTSIMFVDDKAYTNFSNWCGRLRNGNEILRESVNQKKCSDNF